MQGRAKLSGHPAHQMLVVLPLGLLTGAVAFDVVRLVTGNGYWSEIAHWLIVAGLSGALAAAPFGVVDWTSAPIGTRAKRVGALHGAGNVFVVLLFATSLLLRLDARRTPPLFAIALSFAGGALSVVTGWLGGELVDRMGVGVDDGAHLDAPSSLSGGPARG